MGTIWGRSMNRAMGKEIRREDIHKATMEIRMTGTESFGSYNYTRLTPAQKKSFRWHGYHMTLRDDRFNCYVWWRGGIITRLGDTGKNTIQNFIDEVLKEYKYFDGYDCDDMTGEKASEHLTEKNKTMVKLIHQKVKEHNEKMMQEAE